jgi:hypothetical protein
MILQLGYGNQELHVGPIPAAAWSRTLIVERYLFVVHGVSAVYVPRNNGPASIAVHRDSSVLTVGEPYFVGSRAIVPRNNRVVGAL